MTMVFRGRHQLDAHRRLRPERDDLVLVVDGVVEAFLAVDAEPPVAPRHLATLRAGQVLPGTGWAGELGPGEHVELLGNGTATVRLLPPGAPPDDPAAAQLLRDELTSRLAALREPDPALPDMRRRQAADEQRRREANTALTGVFRRRPQRAEPPDLADASPALSALLVAARAAGVRPAAGAVAAARAGTDQGVERLAARLRIPVREVDLSGTWWREDGLPLVVLDAADGAAALVPRRGRWSRWSAGTGWQRVTPAGAGGSARGWCVYPNLPARELTPGDLVRTGLPPGSGADLWRLFASSVAVVLLGAGIPLATAAILGDAVPSAQQGNVVAIALGVAGLILGFSAVTVAQGLLLQRLVVQANVRTTAALWARVLRLDPPFFRGFNPGELARRVLAVDGIRDLVTSSVIAGGIGVLIGLTGVGVALLLDLWVGLAALAGLLCYAGYATRQLRRMVRAHRREVTQRNAIGGFVTAVLTGIVKVRVANAESRLYARWAAMFAREQAASARALAAGRQLTVLTSAVPALATLVVIATTTYAYQARLSVGVFVGLVAALTQVTTALSLVGPALAQLTEAVPLYDAARPVLRTAPREAAEVVDPGVLRGAVEVSKVSFGYGGNAPPSLYEVDLAAAAGEFVAVVGPSGAGKSTLIRLLLGFDRPTSGAVLYDGRPLDTLDVEAVRRQVGVVMQNAQVPTGSILTAIVGTAHLSQDEAWAALELAGLADDVRRMPMGIRTVISEGAATFSGGQRQRLAIARALVRRPRILIFDEATSALDNVTQGTVTRSLQELNATRIVIAHRLSTIRDAHTIYVLRQGRVVERGGYADLLAADGDFAQLARRQLA